MSREQFDTACFFIGLAGLVGLAGWLLICALQLLLEADWGLGLTSAALATILAGLARWVLADYRRGGA